MNNELKEGMYVRTKDGYIAKAKKEQYEDGDMELGQFGYVYFETDNNYNKDSLYILEEDITKASYNIIDLIEVGDYVNGYRVAEVNNNLNEHEGICNSLDTYLWCVNDLGKFEEIIIFENEIKSIVTKEQFESMSYKVGE